MSDKKYDVFVTQGNMQFQMNDEPEGFYTKEEADNLLDKLMHCKNLKFVAKNGAIVCFPDLTGVRIVATPQ